jgi:hypothetical protein
LKTQWADCSTEKELKDDNIYNRKYLHLTWLLVGLLVSWRESRPTKHAPDRKESGQKNLIVLSSAGNAAVGKPKRRSLMGTNFYVEPLPPCECCGRAYERKHIGKSSAGWCFSLHVYPDEGINTLQDWKKYLEGKTIKDEYDRTITLPDLIERITERSHSRGLSRHEGEFS